MKVLVINCGSSTLQFNVVGEAVMEKIIIPGG
jgi:acetate kinase